LSKVNGGNDFDEDMLDEVYVAIKYVHCCCCYCLYLLSLQFIKLSLILQNLQWSFVFKKQAVVVVVEVVVVAVVVVV